MLSALLRRYLLSLYTNAHNERKAARRLLLSPDPQAVLLDCGCREMTTTAEIVRLLQPRFVIGIDHEAGVLKEARLAEAGKVQADLNRGLPLPDASVDVVTAIDVIEHLVEPYLMLKEVYRVLKPGGYLVLDTPNLASWHNVAALIWGVQPFSGPNITTMRESDVGAVSALRQATYRWSSPEEYHADRERKLARHIVVMAYKSLRRVLLQQGFVIAAEFGFGYYPFPPPLARVLQQLDKAHAHHILIKAVKPT